MIIYLPSMGVALVVVFHWVSLLNQTFPCAALHGDPTRNAYCVLLRIQRHPTALDKTLARTSSPPCGSADVLVNSGPVLVFSFLVSLLFR